MNTPYPYPDLPRPVKQGLYDPRFEHDACGVGLVADIKGRKSHDIIEKGLEALINLGHRGAAGADPETGDGAGLLIQMPHEFFAKEAAALGFDLPESGRLRRRHGLPSPGPRRAGKVHSPRRANGPRRGLPPSRLARRAHRPRRHRRAVPRSHAGHPAVLRRPPGGPKFPTSVIPAKARPPLSCVSTSSGGRSRTAPATRTSTSSVSPRTGSYTRASSWHVSLSISISISAIRTSRPASRWCIRGSARTRSARGGSPIPIGTLSTTARSTPCAATSTG